MSISATSREAYQSIGHKLGDKQRTIYNVIKESDVPINNEQIADRVGWPINCVTGRVCELRYMGMVVAEAVGFSKSGRRTKLWSVCDLNDRNLIELDCAS